MAFSCALFHTESASVSGHQCLLSPKPLLYSHTCLELSRMCTPHPLVVTADSDHSCSRKFNLLHQRRPSLVIWHIQKSTGAIHVCPAKGQGCYSLWTRVFCSLQYSLYPEAKHRLLLLLPNCKCSTWSQNESYCKTKFTQWLAGTLAEMSQSNLMEPFICPEGFVFCLFPGEAHHDRMKQSLREGESHSFCHLPTVCSWLCHLISVALNSLTSQRD